MYVLLVTVFCYILSNQCPIFFSAQFIFYPFIDFDMYLVISQKQVS